MNFVSLLFSVLIALTSIQSVLAEHSEIQAMSVEFQCQKLGFTWGRICQGHGNYGVWKTGCRVGAGLRAICPEAWDYQAREGFSDEAELVCGLRPLKEEVEPSGC